MIDRYDLEQIMNGKKALGTCGPSRDHMSSRSCPVVCAANASLQISLIELKAHFTQFRSPAESLLNC